MKPMSFEGVVLSGQKEVVRIFFKKMWDGADKSLIPNCSIPISRFVALSGPCLEGMNSLQIT